VSRVTCVEPPRATGSADGAGAIGGLAPAPVVFPAYRVTMRRIGLLGGMSWESSIEYERIINTEVRERCGGVTSADLVIRSVDFSVIESLQAADQWNEAGDLLVAEARLLEAAGSELLVLCTNTMHRLADRIMAAISIPFIHIADATAAAIHRAGVDTVGLLGTRYTMEADFYAGRLRDEHDLDVIVPDADGRALVHRIIYDELVRGVVDDGSRTEMLGVIESLVADGAGGINAGCTEIELLVTPSEVTVPYFPTARLHALAAVDAALASSS